jgi:cytochrome c biogenesis protein|tara:strand:+ start:5706 stop:6983 length:1278 start_codon:yes stop_codon:yes gene_type:complete
MRLKIIRSFAQLNVAILLLLIIAGFSILGTIIEQDQTIQYYQQNYSEIFSPLDISFGNILLFFGLDHVYKTWWFLSLLFLFGTCLISCTFTQQLPALRIARRYNFKTSKTEFKRQEYQTILGTKYFSTCLENFKQKKYTIFQQQQIVYTYKGILGRFAPIIVHVSMLLILLGNTIAAWGSFNAQELIAKGEIFQVQNTISKSFFTNIPDYPIRVNDFWIEYGPTNNIKQFYSDLSVLNQTGNELSRKTISVNFPLRFKTLTLYQTDWNAIGLRVKLGDKQYQLPLVSLNKSKNLWVTWIPTSETGQTGLTFISNSLNGTFSLYNEVGTFIGTYNLGEKIIQNIDISVVDIITETGLQIKTDPGIPLIYFGFGLLMISSLISYFSFTQFWLAKKDDQLFIGGTSNRAKLNLRLEFLSLTVPYLSKN